MVDDANNSITPQLPNVPAGPQGVPVAPNVPTATLPLAASTPQTGVVQAALGVLMNTNLTPYEMARQFAQLKEGYLAKTYGITIE